MGQVKIGLIFLLLSIVVFFFFLNRDTHLKLLVEDKQTLLGKMDKLKEMLIDWAITHRSGFFYYYYYYLFFHLFHDHNFPLLLYITCILLCLIVPSSMLISKYFLTVL